ncbi:MAG: hypothetical protein R3C27_01500 [Hyphomonadaceae bacterium]
MAQLHTTMRGKKNDGARGALRARTSDVLDDFSELRKDMGRLAGTANKAARDEIMHAGHRLEAIANDVRARASDGAGYAIKKARERPRAALGVSLGAGLLIGLLLARR